MHHSGSHLLSAMGQSPKGFSNLPGQELISMIPGVGPITVAALAALLTGKRIGDRVSRPSVQSSNITLGHMAI